MTSDIFYDWFKSFCRQIKLRPLLLIYDGHLSHLSYEIISFALRENVTIIKLPSHTTDVLQPLDKTCFRPMKVAWDKALLKWQRENSRAMSKADFADLLSSAWHDGIKCESIVSGFLSTGIYPYNRSKYPVSRLNPEKLEAYHQQQKKKSAIDNQQNLVVPEKNSQQESNEKESAPTDQSTPSPGSSGLASDDQKIIVPTGKENSFEALLLSKFGKTSSTQKPRRKIDTRAKVITTEEFLKSIENIAVKKSAKKIKKEATVGKTQLADAVVEKKKPKKQQTRAKAPKKSKN